MSTTRPRHALRCLTTGRRQVEVIGLHIQSPVKDRGIYSVWREKGSPLPLQRVSVLGFKVGEVVGPPGVDRLAEVGFRVLVLEGGEREGQELLDALAAVGETGEVDVPLALLQDLPTFCVGLLWESAAAGFTAPSTCSAPHHLSSLFLVHRPPLRIVSSPAYLRVDVPVSRPGRRPARKTGNSLNHSQKQQT